MVLLGLLVVYGLASGVENIQGSIPDGGPTAGHAGGGQQKAQVFESSDEGPEREFLYAGRSRRAPADPQQDKCSYTFIVPQQKVTGAICVNSKEPEALLGNRVNKQELELLNVELHKQKRQIETLQQLVEVDGGIVNEVKLLRKESRNMNSRVTQLYMQLLHEIIRKRDNALELAQMENRILNQTSEMQLLTSRYKDLEHKYQHLASLATNQSALIVLLEEHCQSRPVPRAVPRAAPRPLPVPRPQPRAQPPPPAPPLNRHFQPPVAPRINNQITNEIQSDQKSPVLPTMPGGTHSPSTTDKPSGKSASVCSEKNKFFPCKDNPSLCGNTESSHFIFLHSFLLNRSVTIKGLNQNWSQQHTSSLYLDITQGKCAILFVNLYNTPHTHTPRQNKCLGKTKMGLFSTGPL